MSRTKLCRSLKKPIVAALCTLCLAMPGRMRGESAETRIAELRAGLLSADRETRVRAYKAWSDAREEEVELLVGLVFKQHERPDFLPARELASKMLSQLRGVRGTRALIANVEYEQKPSASGEDSALRGYPCALALCDTGLNAVPEILWYLRSTNPSQVSDKAVDLLSQIVNTIYGYDNSTNGGFNEALSVAERFHSRSPKDMRVNIGRLISRMKEVRVRRR